MPEQAATPSLERSYKAFRGIGMEGAIARWYSRLTSKSIDEFRLLARRIANELPPRADVLEVAPGPGFFSVELAKLGDFEITGLDISRTFVAIASQNANQANVNVRFECGDAGHMPFAADGFDFVLCRAAFKNFSQPVAALSEMHRVLKPGGRALIIDMRGDADRESIRAAAKGMRVSLLNQIIVYLTFRFMLVRRAYTSAQFEQMIAGTGFRSVHVTKNLIGLEILLEKS